MGQQGLPHDQQLTISLISRHSPIHTVDDDLYDCYGWMTQKVP